MRIEIATKISVILFIANVFYVKFFTPSYIIIPFYSPQM